MAEWWSIEVFSGDRLTASGWRYAYQDELTESAITHGAHYYEWHDTQYGVLFEVLFPSDAEWEGFRALPAVRAALDAVPDPANGLLVYRGRGGAAGGPKPRKPRPAPGSAALEAEVPRRRLRVPRRLKYNASQVGELLPEAGGEPGRVDEPGRGDQPGRGAPPAVPGPPAEPLRVEPDPAEPVWRGIAAFDRSAC
jgi:hypothetical protein